jgi:hypothetical protein
MPSPEVHAGSRSQDGKEVTPVAGREQFLKGYTFRDEEAALRAHPKPATEEFMVAHGMAQRPTEGIIG